jgi:hypothetical protein
VTSDIAHHLLDGVDPEILVTAETVATQVPGVEHAHEMRPKISGSWVLKEASESTTDRNLLSLVSARAAAAAPSGPSKRRDDHNEKAGSPKTDHC